MATFDYVIENGKIYDGSLQMPYVADIAIRGDKIVGIGRWDNVEAQTIDAAGCVVAPGFIDVHHHLDLSFLEALHDDWSLDVRAELAVNASSLRQGVTTLVTGNCGYGFARIDDWLQTVESEQLVQKVKSLIPHGALRTEIFGEAQPERLTKAQLQKMKARVIKEMEKGALGMSTGLAYAPGYHATTDELIALAREVARYGGLYATHMRSESGEGILEAIDEVVTIGREANIPVHISHLKLCAPLQGITVERVLERIEAARDAGIDITADQYPYEAGCTHLAYILPLQYQLPFGVKPVFCTAAGKKELYAAAEKAFSNIISPDKIVLVDRVPHAHYEGKSIQEIADAEQRDPIELYVDLVCAERAPDTLFFLITQNVVKAIMQNRYVFTASDSCGVLYGVAKPHPRNYGTFVKKIKQYALEEGIIDAHFAIRSMTALPAEKFQLHGRGMLAANYYADIVILDPNVLNAPADYDNPHQYAEGVRQVFIDGVPVL